MIFAGGIWSVAVLAGLACGYAWVFRAPRWGFYLILAAALLLIAASRLLPEAHPFRQSVSDDLHFLFWSAMIAIPVGAYSLFVRWARRKAEARYDP